MQALRDLLRNQQIDEAATLAEQLIAEQPFNAELHMLMGFVQADQGRPVAAIERLSKAIRLEPDNPIYHYNLAWLLTQNKESERAILAYQQCLRLSPDYLDARWNLGELLRLKEHFRAAIDLFESLLDTPNASEQFVGLHHRLGVCYSSINRQKAAARAFETSLANKEIDHHLTLWEYSHLLLAMGNLKEGWKAYESRYLFDGPTRIAIHAFEYPRWRGESLEERCLLIHGEQGLGDQLMFASVVPLLLSEAARLVLAVHPTLVRLFKTSFPSATVIAHTIANPADVSALPIDYETPIGSLCHHRGPWSTHQSSPQAYLKSDRILSQRSGYVLDQLSVDSAKPKIGLVWAANPGHGVEWGQRRSLKKSIPIDALEPLARLNETFNFYSLQNSECAPTAADAPFLNLIDLHHYIDDMATTAALIDQLDLVVTVDTSVAHLVGGMGKECIILLMHKPDWRWLQSGNKSYWYESAQLLRQDNAGSWSSVIEQLVNSLTARFM